MSTINSFTLSSRNYDVSRNYDPFPFCSHLVPSSPGDVLQKYSLGTALACLEQATDCGTYQQLDSV